MSKEFKWWIFFAVATLLIFSALAAVSAAQSTVQSAENILSYPGQILQAIWNAILSLFSGSGPGQGETDDINDSTMAEEGLTT